MAGVFHPQPPAAVATAPSLSSPSPAPALPSLPPLPTVLPGVKGVAAPRVPPLADALSAPAEDGSAASLPPPLVRVRTNVLDLMIDLKGGNISLATLPTYPVHKDQPGEPLEMMSPDPARFFAFQGGLRAGDGQPEANHLATFTATATDFVFAPGATELRVPLRWESGTGVVVTKTYTFRPDQFQVDLEYILENNGAAPYAAAEYLQIQRLFTPVERSMFDVETYSFNGPVAYNGQKYEKLDVEELPVTPSVSP